MLNCNLYNFIYNNGILMAVVNDTKVLKVWSLNLVSLWSSFSLLLVHISSFPRGKSTIFKTVSQCPSRHKKNFSSWACKDWIKFEFLENLNNWVCFEFNQLNFFESINRWPTLHRFWDSNKILLSRWLFYGTAKLQALVKEENIPWHPCPF